MIHDCSLLASVANAAACALPRTSGAGSMPALSLRWTRSSQRRLVSALVLLAACASDEGTVPDVSAHHEAEAGASIDGAQDPVVASDRDARASNDASSD